MRKSTETMPARLTSLLAFAVVMLALAAPGLIVAVMRYRATDAIPHDAPASPAQWERLGPPSKA